MHRRLTGGGDTARYMTFADLADVGRAGDELRAVTRAWCDSKDRPQPAPQTGRHQPI